jgi:ribonuclease BN (tRNA processing enzyme)
MAADAVVSPDSFALTVLGSSGSYPGPGRACSGYLLRAAGTSVWVDAGSGTLANLQQHVPLEAVDAVVISHQHVDHWTDIESFYVACRYVIKRDGIPVYAGARLPDLLRTGPTEGTFVWHTIAAGDHITIGPMRFTFSKTDHPVETLAMRIEANGKSLGYSADSGPAWSLQSLGPDLDMALCEASFLQDQEGSLQHLSGRQAGAMAREAGVKRLVITHIMPRINPEDSRTEAAAAFGRPVDVAQPNQTYLV